MPLTEEQLNAPAEPGSILEQLQLIAKEQAESTPPPTDVELETPPVQAVAPPPSPPAESTDPNVYAQADGSSITIEKSSKGWKATLDLGPTGGGRTEVFYGNTKDEMWRNVGIGKLNSTKKIRELNRSLKLGTNVEPAAPAPAPRPVSGRALTAEEQVAVNLKFQTNPAEALDELVRIRHGRSLDEIVQQADNGAQALREIKMGEVAREFVTAAPTYYPTDENYEAIIGLLAKNHLRRTLTAANRDQIINTLVDSGKWTVDNLVDAFEELTESGLLEIAPVRRAAAPAPAPVLSPELPDELEEETPPPTERIVRTERRPRAGFGLRSNESSASAPPPPESPSVEDLNNLSDAALTQLFEASVRLRQQQLSGRRPQ